MKSLTLIPILLFTASAFGVDVTGGNSPFFNNENAAFQVNGQQNKTYDGYHIFGNKNTGASVLNSSNITLSNFTVENNGANGLGGVNAKNVTFSNSTIRGNNHGVASPAWMVQPSSTVMQVNGLWYLIIGNEGGGGKWFNCDGITLRNDVISDNGGVGEWFDSQCTNITVDTCEFINAYQPPNQSKDLTVGLGIENNVGPFTLTNNLWQNAKLAIQESQNITIKNGVIDSCVMEFRDMPGVHPTRLSNVIVDGLQFKNGANIQIDGSIPLAARGVAFKNISADTQATVNAINAITPNSAKLVATASIVYATTQPTTAPIITPAQPDSSNGSYVGTIPSATGSKVNSIILAGTAYTLTSDGHTKIGVNVDTTTGNVSGLLLWNGQVLQYANGQFYDGPTGQAKPIADLRISVTTAPTTDQSAQLKADQLTISQLQAQVTRLLNALNGITSQARAATQP